jgi:hypothetical protein
MKFQQFPGKNSIELTPVYSAGTMSVFGQEGSIFSICCSTGEFLLHFLKVILTVIAYRRAKAAFTDCYLCRDAVGWGLAGRPHGQCFLVKQEVVHSVFICYMNIPIQT